MLEYSHNGLFALAALAVALFAGFSGLSLTRGASSLSVTGRQALIAVAAVILGWGIWSMHFVAMLGLNLPMAYYFDPLTTLISACMAILITELALVLVHFGRRTKTRISLAGAVLGIGVAVMHYIGMSGMQICQPVYSLTGVTFALLASIALGILSFQLCYSERNARNIVLGTLGFGLTVFAVHFIAMGSTGFVATGDAAPHGLPMSNQVLAFGVTISAFVLSGLFLLSGASFTARLSGDPQGGAQGPSATDPDVPPEPPSVPTPLESQPIRIPYEADQRTHFIPAQDVSAIRAEGHYTLLYAGDAKLFCPWSITEASKRLPDHMFTRTHRSYLVNRSHVTSFEKRKDNGVCYFDQTPSLPKVPVSRGRLHDVRAQLGM